MFSWFGSVGGATGGGKNTMNFDETSPDSRIQLGGTAFQLWSIKYYQPIILHSFSRPKRLDYATLIIMYITQCR